MTQDTAKSQQAITRVLQSDLLMVGALMTFWAVSGCDLHGMSNGGASQKALANSDMVDAQHSASAKTIGLVLADLEVIRRANDRKTDCPNGFHHTNRENWEAQFRTSKERKIHMDRCGDLRNRGPNCEDIWFNPEVIEDPLSFREVRGKIAYGVNLDDERDGKATTKTCAHEQFIGPDGEAGIDNQFLRFIGCEKAWEGFPEVTIRRGLARNQFRRPLLEISKVDDEQNDAAVEVAIYRGRDWTTVDAAGKAVPWQSQRIAEGPASLMVRTHGRIVDGVLLTEPVDLIWEDYMFARLFIRGMSLQLKLTATGAEGLRIGYMDTQQLWHSYKQVVSQYGTLFGASGPAAYAALHQLADGYKDPGTGACTALSSALKVEFVRAHLIHPAQGNSQ